MPQSYRLNLCPNPILYTSTFIPSCKHMPPSPPVNICPHHVLYYSSPFSVLSSSIHIYSCLHLLRNVRRFCVHLSPPGPVYCLDYFDPGIYTNNTLYIYACKVIGVRKKRNFANFDGGHFGNDVIG